VGVAQFPGDVGDDRLQDVEDHEVPFGPDLAVLLFHQGVKRFHTCGDQGVERPCLFKHFHRFFQRFVDLQACFLLLFGEACVVDGREGIAGIDVFAVAHQAPDKLGAPFNGVVVPLQLLRGRCGKEDKETGRIGAVLLDQGVGVDRIPLGLAHLCPVFEDHSLGQEVFKRFVEIHHLQVVQDLGEITGVEQVQDRVLDPPDIEVHLSPVLHILFFERQVERLGLFCHVAQEVPAGFHEGIQGIGLAHRFATAFGAGGVLPARVVVQRVPFPGDLHILGQGYGQVLFGFGNRAAAVAVDQRDRGPPVALA